MVCSIRALCHWLLFPVLEQAPTPGVGGGACVSDRNRGTIRAAADVMGTVLEGMTDMFPQWPGMWWRNVTFPTSGVVSTKQALLSWGCLSVRQAAPAPAWEGRQGVHTAPVRRGGGLFRDVSDRPYTVGGGGIPPPWTPLPPPPPLSMFDADSQNFASAPSAPRGFKLKDIWPAFGGDHRRRGSQPNPPSPPPLQTPPAPF